MRRFSEAWAELPPQRTGAKVAKGDRDQLHQLQDGSPISADRGKNKDQREDEKIDYQRRLPAPGAGRRASSGF